MKAIFRAARGGLMGRRLQAAIIGLVVLAATATSVVALGLLADAHSPFDRAFEAQRGADVTAAVDTSVATPPQIAATSRLAGVAAAAGPYPEVLVSARITTPGVPGSSPVPVRIVGRASPGGPVDDLTLLSGHWPRSDTQVVMARGTGVFPGATLTAGSRKLTVTGVAESVTGTAGAWVLPPAVGGLGGARQAQVLYRFASAGTTAAVAADIASVRAALPRGALTGTISWLAVRRTEQSRVAPWVPFIIAFGAVALVISVLIVVDVVGGAVIAGTTRIGVLKSIGFSPAQVVVSYVLLAGVPALAGCVAGAVCGNLLAVPLLTVNSDVYQVGALHVPVWVDAAVPLGAFALTVVGAVPPAWRAGRLSAIAAITAGRAPRPAHGYLAHRALARPRSAPRAVTLGLAAPSARPARTMVTVAAILFGAAAVTFGAGLAASLTRVVSDTPEASLPVQVLLNPAGPAPGGPGVMTAAQQRAVAMALAAQPGTRHYLAVSSGQVSLPGVAGTASVTAYSGDPAWTGMALISGRWYSGRTAEADVNTLFLTDTGTSVGSTCTLVSGGHRVTVRIVGEVFAPGSNADVYTSPATLTAVDPGAGPGVYDVALRPGTSPQAYANALSAALGHSYRATAHGAGSSQFTAVIVLVTMLTILITAVAGLGVLNTVALQIRERARDIGVFKALGMTPWQTLTMILCSVAVTGLAAGIAAVPAGVYLHHGVVPLMAHAANSGYPTSVISVYSPAELILLALAGLIIAVAGALGPAVWAARARTAFALRAE